MFQLIFLVLFLWFGWSLKVGLWNLLLFILTMLALGVVLVFTGEPTAINVAVGLGVYLFLKLLFGAARRRDEAAEMAANESLERRD